MPAVQTVVYNLANPNHFWIVVSKLGGEQMIRRQYPELFKILMYSRDMAAREACKQQILRSDGAANPGFVDYAGIRNLECANGKVSCTADMGTVAKMPTLAIIGEIKDVYRGISVDNCAVYDTNSHFLDSAMRALCPKSQKYDYIAETTFTKIEYDREGKPIIKSSTHVQETTSEIDASNIIEKIDITDPMPKNTHGSETVIFYNNRKGRDCDYYYDNVSQYDDHVQIMIPFSGSVELKAPFVPMYVDKNNGFILRIDTQTNGAIQFGMAGWNKIRWTQKGNTLSWQFPDDWNNFIYKSGVKQVNHVDFYCRMPVSYSIKNNERNQNSIPIIISSMDNSSGSAVKKVSRLDIQWGCFSKNTMIKMSDGSMKLVCEVKAGQQVMTQSGAALVTGIISGEEKKITVITTFGGKTIRVSSDHPILTKSGWVNADDLTAADVLLTVSGLEGIAALYTEDYNDKVFSIKTDGDGSLIADGIFAGDFGQQNKLKASIDEEPLNEFQQEFADLMQNLAKKQEEYRG